MASLLGRTGGLVDELDLPPQVLKDALAAADRLAGEVAESGEARKREILRDLVERIVVRAEAVDIHVKRQALAVRLLGDRAPDGEGTILIEAPISVARRGVETKLVIEGDVAGTPDREPDAALLKAVARGHAWFDDLVSGRAGSVKQIATREDFIDRYVARLLDLAFLPPALVEDIIEGRQPADMTAESISRVECPLLWSTTFAR